MRERCLNARIADLPASTWRVYTERVRLCVLRPACPRVSAVFAEGAGAGVRMSNPDRQAHAHRSSTHNGPRPQAQRFRARCPRSTSHPTTAVTPNRVERPRVLSTSHGHKPERPKRHAGRVVSTPRVVSIFSIELMKLFRPRPWPLLVRPVPDPCWPARDRLRRCA